MDLRTTIDIIPSSHKITYDDRVMFIGSCFASSIGLQMAAGHLPVMINPSGTVYNPVSVCNTLDTIIERKQFVPDDLYNHNGQYLSFSHYTDFSSYDPDKVIKKINVKAQEANEFLKSSGFLFITFGTARVYRFKESGQIVSNCHKLPSEYFEEELLSVDYIVTLWKEYLDKLHTLFPRLKVIFTISPVRHWKDGAFGNLVSKSVLFLAVNELLKHQMLPMYFPAYELVMDDLRDYRFYNDDMLHPSAMAVSYIWEAFAKCYMESKTLNIWKELVKISKACNHRLNNAPDDTIKDFSERMLNRISEIEVKVSSVDLSYERKYFRNLLDKKD